MTRAPVSDGQRQAAADFLAGGKGTIIDAVVAEGRRRGNVVALGPEFTDQVSDCIDRVCAELSGGAPTRPDEWGQRKAGDPSETREAALLFFRTATRTIVTGLADRPGMIPEVLSVLHRNVVERMMTATVRYMDFLISDIQATQVDERRRISREIHDRVASGVSAAHRNLELAGLDGGGTDARIDAARAAFAESLAALEEISSKLFRPLAEETLQAMVTRYLPLIGTPLPKVTSVFHGDDSVLPQELSVELFLIIREAVRNALRHANAQNIAIETWTHETEFRCIVQDDGIGFDLDEIAPDGHTGLASMRERAQALGGRCFVTSSQGEGTAVETVVPLDR